MSDSNSLPSEALPPPPEVRFGPCRQSAKDVLAGIIHEKKDEIDALVTLHESIPWDRLDEARERVLWKFFLDLRRR